MDETGLEGGAGMGRESSRRDFHHHPHHCLCPQVFPSLACYSFSIFVSPSWHFYYDIYCHLVHLTSGVLLLGVLVGAALLGHRRSSSRARARKLARLNGVKVGTTIIIFLMLGENDNDWYNCNTRILCRFCQSRWLGGRRPSRQWFNMPAVMRRFFLNHHQLHHHHDVECGDDDPDDIYEKGKAN